MKLTCYFGQITVRTEGMQNNIYTYSGTRLMTTSLLRPLYSGLNKSSVSLFFFHLKNPFDMASQLYGQMFAACW